MSLYLRVSRNTGISVPLVFAPVVYLAWLTVMVVAWTLMLLALGVLEVARGVGWAVNRLEGKR